MSATADEEYRAPGSTRHRVRTRRQAPAPVDSPDLVSLLCRCVVAVPMLVDDLVESIRAGVASVGPTARLVPETLEVGYLTVERAGRRGLRVVAISAKVERGEPS